MNSRDFAREMDRARRERAAHINPINKRRLALIAKMEADEGTLSETDAAELVRLQRQCGLPHDLGDTA